MTKAKSKSTSPKREAEAPAPISKKAEAKRQKALAQKPDGLAAFHAICEMEAGITRIEQMMQALRMVACDSSLDDTESGAISGIATVIQDALDGLQENYSKAWKAAWGFEFGEGKAAP
jgi:hypothetical protein